MSAPDRCGCTPRQPCPVMRRLLREQAGVVAVRQGIEHGWSRQGMRDQFTFGRWGHPGRGVYVTHTGRLSYEERIFSGLAACGHGAVASHDTALWLADQGEAPPKNVHITVPTTNHLATSQPDLHIHRSRTLAASDVHPARRPPRVTVERVVLDCARIAGTDDEAIAAIARTVQRGLTTAIRL